MRFLLDKSDLGVYNRNIMTERQTMFWFKLKNNLKLIMSALWDDKEKFTKLKNEINAFQSGGQVDASKLWGDDLYTKLENDKNLTKLKSEQDIERVAKYIKRQQDLSFRSQVSRR